MIEPFHQKIYYPSQQDPNDQTMKTYYEEMGVPPQVYVTSTNGEDIRALSKEFLGHKDSWKEVWSTNLAIESKGSLPNGTEIKYWPESVVAAKPPEPTPAPMPEPTPMPVVEAPPPMPEPTLPPMPEPTPDLAAAPIANQPPPNEPPPQQRLEPPPEVADQ